MITETDCRTDTGITVGLVDTIITVARILRKSDLAPTEVQEALRDLLQDDDFLYLLRSTA